MDQKYIEYNKSNEDRARKLRKEMTRAEKKMWFEILSEKPLGYKRIRQKMIDNFIVDFYCSKLMLAIEIDGDSHSEQEIYDATREEKLRNLGIRVIRYTNDEVFANIQGVYDDLMRKMK